MGSQKCAQLAHFKSSAHLISPWSELTQSFFIWVFIVLSQNEVKWTRSSAKSLWDHWGILGATKGNAFCCHRSTSGDQNRVKTAPQPIFAQKAFVPLCIPGFSPFMAHPNISLCFWVMGRRVKILRFSLIFVSAHKKIWRPIASSISMPPTFHS